MLFIGEINKKYKLINNPFPEDKDMIEKLSDPNYEGNLGLPLNPTPLQVAKFNICQKILGYKLDNGFTRDQVAKILDLSLVETEDILFCCIKRFALDRLLTYASRLFSPSQIKVIVESKSKLPRQKKYSCPNHLNWLRKNLVKLIKNDS